MQSQPNTGTTTTSDPSKPESTLYNDSIIYEYHKHLRKVTLNRPKALNALSFDMMNSLNSEAQNWKASPDTKVVVFTGAGDRAFCAGGDIKGLYELQQDESKRHLINEIFQVEYSLDAKIAEMKPIQISIWDGITMGGGVGISVHAPIRIVTEACVFAMPEARIGLFTDVGAGYFLSRLRNKIGYLLSLTGARLKASEVVQVGLADFYVKKEKLLNLENEILEKTTSETTLEDLRTIVQKYSEPVEMHYQNEEFINQMFEKESVEEIYQALQSTVDNKELADSWINLLDQNDPVSIKVCFELLRRNESQNLSLREDLKMEKRLALRFVEGTNFYEGIRCTLIDRNDQPKRTHNKIEDVTKEEVDRYFATLPDHLELQF